MLSRNISYTRTVLFSDTLSSTTSAITCPTAMQNYYTYNMTVGGVTSCNPGSTLDVCTKTSTFTFNGSNCTTTLGYTGESEGKTHVAT